MNHSLTAGSFLCFAPIHASTIPSNSKNSSTTLPGSVFLPANPIRLSSHLHQNDIIAYDGDKISPAKALRKILESPVKALVVSMLVFSSALLVPSHFSIRFFIAGYMSFGQVLDQGRQIAQAVSIPVIVDGENGYGNAMNAKRTVKEFIKAGFAGIILEDQVPSMHLEWLANYITELSLLEYSMLSYAPSLTTTSIM